MTMEILQKLATLNKSIKQTDDLVDKLLIKLQEQKISGDHQGKKIIYLKEEVRNNINKIDKIIEEYNANS